MLFTARRDSCYKKLAPRPITMRGYNVNTTKRVSFLVASMALLAASAAWTDPVAVEAGASGRAAERNDVLEEIVVTAEKRASTVQDTPISMTAMSGDLMQQEGISNISGIIQ